MIKEIHFYTDLCDEIQVPDSIITEILVDYINTKNAIEIEKPEIIRTTQLGFIKNAVTYRDNGIMVYFHNDGKCTAIGSYNYSEFENIYF